MHGLKISKETLRKLMIADAKLNGRFAQPRGHGAIIATLNLIPQAKFYPASKCLARRHLRDTDATAEVEEWSEAPTLAANSSNLTSDVR